jgi:uncharacterized membrane protein YbhN (UPF0104 family)
VLLLGLGLLIAARRWQLILRAMGVAVPWTTAARLTYVGAFFSTFLPGSTGGDIAKGYYVWKLNSGRRLEGPAGVLADRAMGMLTLFVIAGVSFLALPVGAGMEPVIGRVIMATLGVLFACVALALCCFVWRRRFVENLALRVLPERLLTHPAVSGLKWSWPAGNARNLIAIFSVSMLSQFIYFAGAFLVAFALDSSVHWSVWLAYFPIILAVSALPVTVSGIGLREYLFVHGATPMGFASSEAALLASLLIFASMLVQNAAGGVAYLMFRPETSDGELTIRQSNCAGPTA